MRTKSTSLLLAALVLGTAVLAFMPTAEAQKQTPVIQVSLTPPTENVKPLQQPITFKGTAKFLTEGTARTALVGVPATIEAIEKPAWANVVISPSSAVFTMSQTQTEATVDFSVTISATEQAPAFQPGTIKIQVSTPDSPAFAATKGQDSTLVQADFFSIIDVQLAETIKVDRPQTPVVFPLKVTNFGNANTKVSFEVVGDVGELKVPLPNPVTLQSRQAGGNQISADVALTIQTPYRNGYMNEVGVVNYKITSAYALDSKVKGDENTVSVVVTTRGFYVPGVSPLAFVAALGLAAALFRRRL